MRIGVLDLGLISDSLNSSQVLSNTIRIAKEAEALGFSRYWLAEHYKPYVAWNSAESLVGILPGITHKIKIGTAGIILPGSNPLRIAQNFKILQHFYPGRIDLGIAKGYIPPSYADELVGSERDFLRNQENHHSRFAKLIDFIRNVDKDILVPPKETNEQSIWALCSSRSNLHFAIEKKISLSLSLFHSPKFPEPEILSEYREKCQEQYSEIVCSNIAISLVCGQTDKKTNEILQTVPKDMILNIAGTKNYVMDKIYEIAEKYSTKEIIIADFTSRYIDKLNTLDVISEFIKE